MYNPPNMKEARKLFNLVMKKAKTHKLREPNEIGYPECANAMLKMWIDNVVTDGEYNRIMDKLNAHWKNERN